MTTARLVDLQTLEEVAKACGIDASRIQEFANAPNQRALYATLKIKKRSPRRSEAYRVVFKSLSAALSNFHRSIAMIVVNSSDFGEHVQGFVKRRSTYTNAQRHLGAKLLLHADITGFFDAITTEHVREAFVVSGSPPELAATLARACTIDGRLRQGTRCAPALANLVCQHLDVDMLALARSTGTVYSRYADDITFSGSNAPSSKSVQHILNRHGFSLRDGKCYLQHRGRDQYVTGLTIADATQPRLPRRLKRRLRLELYYAVKYGVGSRQLEDGAFPYKLEGMLRYVHSIEPLLATKLRRAIATQGDLTPE